jgi:regulator of protease activity HflC (stomatin/prohibitin superfamily)
VIVCCGVALIAVGANQPLNSGSQIAGIVGGLIVVCIGGLGFTALKINAPGQTRVLQFFGTYVGTIRRPGLWWTMPLTSATKVSVKVRNFETSELKVNDADGNPVNIAAIIVWQVDDTAKATFAVERFEKFVAVQSESALRHIATSHPYDTTNPDVESLRGSTELIAQELADEVASRILLAGLRVVETRISSLAYAPEIAQAMLQRQQAAAIIAAREKIVEGAVTMVQSALTRLEHDHIVQLDDERKATMVANLLVVLCGDQRATPVINAGSLYGN